jgi:hypothetical protein
MIRSPDKQQYSDPTLPLAMWIFAAVVVVVFFGMVVTSAHIALRPSFDPTTVSKLKAG